MVNNKLEFTGSEFFDVLREFQDRVKEGAFKKTVPYDIWRKLKLTQKPVSFDFIEDYQLGEILFDEGHSYSEYFSEEGLIAFLYDKWIVNVKEEEDLIMHDVLKATLTDSTNDSILASKIEPETNGTIMISSDDFLIKGEKTQNLEDLIDNLNARIDKLVKNLNKKVDVDTIEVLNDYITQNISDIDRLEIETSENRGEINYAVSRLEVKTSENHNKINCLENSFDELRECITVLTDGLSTANDVIFDLQEKFINLVEKENKKKVKNKENNAMKNFNFDFGPCTNDNVRMSMYGLAVKNAAGTYVSLNPSTREVVDVDIFNFEGGKYLFKMPVAIKDIAVGDVIIHNKKPMFVEGFSPLGDIIAIDPVAGERKEVMLTRSPFGFNYATKVVNLFGAGGMATPNADNPFGNMLPFVLMNEEGGDIDPMMLMFMMGQSGGANTSAFGNPMMMYFLMKDKGEIDPMMMFMMMNQQRPNTCQCGCAENKA